MSKTFANKVVLITGGTTGIGRAAAVAFAREGAKVVLSGRRAPEGAQTVALVEKEGGEALFVQGDVSDEAHVKALVQAALDKFGRLDVAFNNAGIEEVGMLADATVEQYQRVFDVNVKGVFLSMKHEIPALLKGGGGAIVNTSSIAGSIGMPGAGLYIASKHAVNGLTKAAAMEVAKQNIRINTVSPAAIQTDMLERFVGSIGQADEVKKQFAGMHPVGRFGTPEEVVSAVLYLASPAASFVTGFDLKVDGGFTAQ